MKKSLKPMPFMSARKKVSKRLLGYLSGFLMGGGLWLGILPLALALPIVESRTGDPLVRPGNASISTHTDYESSPLKVQQIEALKEEINNLRGAIEQQQHQLEVQSQALKKSQQDFYVDLDKRLTQLEQPTEALAEAKPTVPKSVKSKTLANAPEATTNRAGIKPAATSDATAEGQEPVEFNKKTEKASYEAASAHLSAKRYAEAIEGFQDCVTRYPQGSYAAQCYYWLGESYMAEWGSHKDDKTLLDKASQSFLMVTTRFPTHQRATDALLKLGMVEQEKGNLEVSKRYFEQVRERYPDSAAARMAETYLQEE